MREEILASVKAAGVVGAGGAGFPTHIKMNAAVDVVIVNGAECEPLLRADQQLMAAESMKLIVGLQTVMLVTGASRGIIGLKPKYDQAVQSLRASLDRLGKPRIELFFLPDFYPAGDEQVLVYEATGRIVPEGGIPLEVGVVVSNVQTMINVAQALEGKPVTDKYVTVTGAVNHPVTLLVPIGTPAGELIRLAGGAQEAEYAVIDGGPMMGKIVSADSPVTKTTGGIIVLPVNHPLVLQKNTRWAAIASRARAACCNCMACTDVCPRYLLGHGLQPHRIMQAVGRGSVSSDAVVTSAFLCSECGVCDSYGCSMGLSPRRVNAELKRQLTQAGVKNPHRQKPPTSRSARDYRRVPVKRLLARLGLERYDVKAPLDTRQITVSKVTLPLRQHIGAPAKPVVAVGQTVKRGDLIAAIPDGSAVSANIHASISGHVTAVNDAVTIEANP
jgi:Na+-translocating ferredoxin:NAD+ oxidoreductase RnfC subunit